MGEPLIAAYAVDLEDPQLRPVDVRYSLTDPAWGRRQYDAGHVPGAVFMDVDTDLSGPPNGGRHPLPNWDAFRATLGRLGIGDDAPVVVYDHGSGSIAARLWWMLDHLGHDDVRVLDGGWASWAEAGRPVSTVETQVFRTQYTRRGARNPVIDLEVLRTEFAGRVLVDARAPNRYLGLEEPIDPVAGHIPGAINAPHADNVDGAGRFLPPEDLRARYADLAGTAPIVYCGSGVTACHDILAMRIAGVEDAVLYPGSWSEWSSAGMPVASGE